MKAINPATDELIKDYKGHTSKEVERIIETVEEDYLKWRQLSFAERGGLMRKAAEILRKKKLEGMELRTRVFPDETHLTAGPMIYVHGIKSIYKKPDVYFLVKDLDKK